MKKKVLFALIALFSVLSAWAVDVTVGDVQVTLDKSYVVGTTPPTMTVVTDGWSQADGVYTYNAAEFKYVLGSITGAGNYFLKVTKGDDARYIPFQVGSAGVGRDAGKVAGTDIAWEEGTFADFDYVHSQASWNTAKANGGLNAYYTAYPGEDVWVFETQDDFDHDVAGAGHYGSCADKTPPTAEGDWPALAKQSWWGAINATGADYPWIVINTRTDAQGAVRPVFEYSDGTQDNATVVIPWGVKAIKNYACASIHGQFANSIEGIGGWKMYKNDDNIADSWVDGDFNMANLRVVLLPDLAAFPVRSSVEYNGINTQGPGVIVAGLPEGYELGLTVKNSLTKAVGISGVGSYYYEVAIIAPGETIAKRIIDSAPFKVTGKKLNVNIAQLTKTYGQDDPIYAKVERDASTPMGEGEDFDNIREAFLFERESNEGADAEKVGPHKYIVHIDPAFPLNYDVSILQNHGYLYIDQAPMTVYVANNSKVYGEDDPDFEADKSVTEKFSIKDAENNDKTADLKDDLTITRKEGSTPNTYAFKGTSASGNYAYYFVPADFTITAKSAEGLTVTASDFTYNGFEQTPTISAGKLTVKDGGNDVDPNLFDVTYSGDCTNATPANATDDQKPTVTVTFKDNNGLYTGSISQTYTIAPADLTIKPKNMVKETGYVFNAAEVTYEYTGLQNNEAAANVITNFNTITTSAVATDDAKVFKLKVNLGTATATNYNLKTAEGVLSIDRAILAVKATAAEKEYGEDDPDFKFTASVQANNADPVDLTATDADAILKLGGKYVFTIDRKSDSEDAGVYENDLDFDGPETLMDYTIQYVPANFTITKAPLYISAAGVNIEVNYGEALPNYTTPGSYTYNTGVTVIGLKDPDTEAILMGTRPDNITPCLIYALDVQKRNADESITPIPYNVTPDAGVYEVYPKARSWYTGDKKLKNYDVIFLPQELTEDASDELKAANKYGKLTVNPIALTATPQDNEKYYGLEDPTLTATVTNAAGQTVANNIFNLTNYFQVVREPGENVKEDGYAISIVRKLKDQPANETDYVELPNNYNVTYSATAKFTINPAVIKVVAKDQAIQYAEAINGYDYEATIVNNMGKLVALDADGKLTETPLTKEQIGHLKTTITKVGANKNAYEFVVDNTNIDEANVDFQNAWLTIYPLKVIPLDMENLAQVLYDHQGYEVEVKMSSSADSKFRRFAPDYWYSLVLPFKAKVRDIAKAFGYAVVDVMDKKNARANSISLAVYVGEIEANQPFVIKVDEMHNWPEMAAVTFGQQTIAEFDYLNEDPTDTDGYNQFIGTYKPKSDFEVGDYIMRENHGNWQPYEDGKTYDMKQTEAYLKPAAAGAPVRIVIEEADGTTTVINGVDAEAEVAYGEGWYTINGVKLEGEPATSGTYIFNGKKVFIQK